MVTINPEVLSAHAQEVHLLTTQLDGIKKHADSTGTATQWALGAAGQAVAHAVGLKVGAVQDVIGALGERADDVGRRIDHTAQVFGFSENANKTLMDKTKTQIHDPDLFHAPQTLNDFPDLGVSGSIAGFASNCPQYSQAGALPLALGTAAFALDILGYALDPVGNIFGEFAGLIIDLIVPLKKLLDLLLGDPGALSDASSAYQDMSTALSEVAHPFAASLTQITPQTWDQPGASDKYLQIANNLVQTMITAGTGAVDISGDLIMLGSAIGDVRSIIFGKATEFVMEALFEAAIGASFAAVTFGGSLAVAAGIIETQAVLAGVSAAAQFLALTLRLAAAEQVAQSQIREFQTMVADIKK